MVFHFLFAVVYFLKTKQQLFSLKILSESKWIAPLATNFMSALSRSIARHCSMRTGRLPKVFKKHQPFASCTEPLFSVLFVQKNIFSLPPGWKKEWMKRHQWNCTKNMGSNSTLTFRYFASSWFHLVRYEPKVYFACRKIKKCRYFPIFMQHLWRPKSWWECVHNRCCTAAVTHCLKLHKGKFC